MSTVQKIAQLIGRMTEVERRLGRIEGELSDAYAGAEDRPPVPSDEELAEQLYGVYAEDTTGSPYTPFSDLDNWKKAWLAVARKARELLG
jgi:hypothetical protein